MYESVPAGRKSETLGLISRVAQARPALKASWSVSRLAPLVQVRLCQGHKHRGGDRSGHSATAPVRSGQDQGVPEAILASSAKFQRLADLPSGPDILAQPDSAYPVPDLPVIDGGASRSCSLGSGPG